MRWLSGHDEEAFKEIMSAWLPLVRTVCQRVLGRSGLADDAVQETFLSLAKHAGEIHGNVGSWLYRTAMNHAIDLKRSEQSRHHRECQFGSDTLRNHDQQVEPAEYEFLLEVAMGELPSDQRRLIQSYFFSGLSQYELADQAGVSQVAIKKRLDRATMALRLKLIRHGVNLIAPSSAGRLQGFVLLPLAQAEALNILGWGLLGSLILQPRVGVQRIATIISTVAHMVASLLGTAISPTAPAAGLTLHASVPTPWWVRAARFGSGSAHQVAILAVVACGRR